MAIHLNLLIFYKINYFLEFTFCLSEWGSIQVHPWLAAEELFFSLLLSSSFYYYYHFCQQHYIIWCLLHFGKWELRRIFWRTPSPVALLVSCLPLDDTVSPESFLFSPSHKCLIDCALELYCCFVLKKKKRCARWQYVSKALGGNQQFSIHEWIHPND